MSSYFKKEIKTLFEKIQKQEKTENNSSYCELWLITVELCSLYMKLLNKWHYSIPPSMIRKHPINYSIETVVLFLSEISVYDENTLIDTKDRFNWLKVVYKKCHNQALVNMKDGLEEDWDDMTYVRRIDEFQEKFGRDKVLSDDIINSVKKRK